MKRLIISMGFLCLLISSAQVQAQTWSPAEKEVLKAIENCDLAYNKEENVEAFIDSCYHDGYVSFRPGTPTPMDKVDLRKAVPIWWANSDVVQVWLKPLNIRIVGDVAIIHYYRYTLSRDKEGTETNSQGRRTDIWVKQEGKWVKIADHGSPTGNN